MLTAEDETRYSGMTPAERQAEVVRLERLLVDAVLSEDEGMAAWIRARNITEEAGNINLAQIQISKARLVRFDAVPRLHFLRKVAP